MSDEQDQKPLHEMTDAEVRREIRKYRGSSQEKHGRSCGCWSCKGS